MLFIYKFVKIIIVFWASLTLVYIFVCTCTSVHVTANTYLKITPCGDQTKSRITTTQKPLPEIIITNHPCEYFYIIITAENCYYHQKYWIVLENKTFTHTQVHVHNWKTRNQVASNWRPLKKCCLCAHLVVLYVVVRCESKSCLPPSWPTP